LLITTVIKLTKEDRMTANEKVAQRKLSMLQLAQELKSVSEACRLMGYSRSQFYEIKRASRPEVWRPSWISPRFPAPPSTK